MQKKIKIAFISLGCDKNRVDLEVVINAFIKNNFELASEEDSDVVVINTCAFIADARDESASFIIEASDRKKMGQIEKLVVMGCLPNYEESDETLKSFFPEVDLFVKISDQKNIVSKVQALFENNLAPCYEYKLGERHLTTIGSYAYLKIADGCNNFCSYCKIPYLRGRLLSRPLKDVVAEAKNLVKGGVKELILVAQDITKYGLDIDDKTNLEALLIELLKIKDLTWIRLLYCYPDGISNNLINLIAKNEKICNYIDIPLQHVSDSVLSKMKRRTTNVEICKMIESLRELVPNIAIRTTFIVGFPGETNKDFKLLCNFVKEKRLSNVGVFKFSREEGTSAYNLPKQISNFTKNRRYKKLYRILEKINAENNLKKVQSELDVVCQNKIGENLYEMRDEFNAPEIDYTILVESKNELIIGEFYRIKIIKITDSCKKLKGEILNELTK